MNKLQPDEPWNKNRKRPFRTRQEWRDWIQKRGEKMKHQRTIQCLRERLTTFLGSSESRKWILLKSVNIYIRNTERLLNGNKVRTLELANITVFKQSQGLGTAVISLLEDMAKLYRRTMIVECVLEDRFYKFLLRIGYQDESPSDSLRGTIMVKHTNQ